MPLSGSGRERSGLPCAYPLPQTHPCPQALGGLWDAVSRGSVGGTNGWGRCALGEKAFSSDPRGCLGVPEPPSRCPSSARSGHRCGVTTVACWAEPPLREGPAGPAVGPSVALLPTAACASPLRVGGGSRRAWPTSGTWGSRVRARECVRACVATPPRPWVSCPVAVRAAVSAARSRAEWPPAVTCGHGSGPLSPGGASPRVVVPGRTRRTGGGLDGPLWRGSRGVGPQRCGARFAVGEARQGC